MSDNGIHIEDISDAAVQSVDKLKCYPFVISEDSYFPPLHYSTSGHECRTG
jgi:hypothetical protein